MILLLTTLATACVKEDNSDCPPEDNLILHFVYEDKDGKDIFADHISHLTVMIFDAAGNFYESLYVGSEYLEENRSLVHSIEPGTYHVLSWANRGSNTETNLTTGDIRSIDGSTITHVQGRTTDALYYAPHKEDDVRCADLEHYVVVVPPLGTKEHTLRYVSAYHILNVFVKGLGGYLNPLRHEPSVQVTDLSSGYDFHLVPSPNTTVFQATSVFEDFDGTEMAVASFRIPHFDMDTPIAIYIKDHLGQEIAPLISLSEFLEKSNKVILDGELRTINIEITYYHGLITVKFLDWEAGDYEPIM